LPQEVEGKPENAAVVLVPCPDSGRAGCRIVHRAVKIVLADIPEVVIATAEDCPKGPKRFVLAIDASTTCQASIILRQCGAKPWSVLSAAMVLADAGLIKPGMDIVARVEELAQALATAIKESLVDVLDEARERRRYREQMGAVMKRFDGIWSKVEALPSLNGLPEAKEKTPVGLIAKRARNLFMKFDEVMPPTQWAEPHDLFQDALLCIAYACEGWAAGDSDRWDHNLEKARVQIEPLKKRLKP